MPIFREILYPERCPGCDNILYPKERPEGFCKKCITKIEAVGDEVCIKCGKKLEDGRKEYCKDCKNTRHSFVQCKAAFVYEGPMKPAMYRFKYSNRRSYGKIFAEIMWKKYGEWMKSNGIQGIVPVPMYRPKERRRGYNQAGVLAKELGRRSGVPVYDNLVLRARNSSPQKNLNPIERKNNLKNAFKIRKSAVKLRKILLIDDIYTTGNTMDAVGVVLLEAGVEQIYGMSVCIGKDKERYVGGSRKDGS